MIEDEGVELLMDGLRSATVGLSVITSVITAFSCGMDREDMKELPEPVLNMIADIVDELNESFMKVGKHMESLKDMMEKDCEQA